MDMPGRTTPPPGSIGQYRYGMNGQMKEGDVFEGFMSADFWGYDSRLGRRWETDPLACVWQSPYATFDNNPILFSDPSGLQAEDDRNKKNHNGRKYEDPVPEPTKKITFLVLRKDNNPQINTDFPATPVHLNLYPNHEVECMEGMVEQGFTVIANAMRFVQGLETGETWEGLYGLAKFAGNYMVDPDVRLNFAFSTAVAINNHFLEYSPNTLGKDIVNVATVIAPFALKAPVAMEVPVYEPALISYEGIDLAIRRGTYVEGLMVNDLNQLYPNLKVMKQAVIKFEGYSATMKADLVLIEETLDGPVLKVIGESKYNGAGFSEGQKLLYVHKEYAILVDGNGVETYFNPDAVKLLEYRFTPQGTYNITPY